MQRLLFLVAAFGLMLLSALPAQAQFNGSHSLGDFGVQSGSQPQPGFYAALFYYRFDTDTIKDAGGRTVRLTPASPGSLALTAVAPIAWYVSKAKVLGGNYGVMVVLPFANASIEAPAFQLARTIDTGIADTLVRPLDLGWHTKRADVAAGFQLYVLMGRYEPGGSDNLGRACGRTSRSWGRRYQQDHARGEVNLRIWPPVRTAASVASTVTQDSRGRGATDETTRHAAASGCGADADRRGDRGRPRCAGADAGPDGATRPASDPDQRRQGVLTAPPASGWWS